MLGTIGQMKSKHTDGKWELRGNRLFVKDTYKSIAIIEVQNNFDIQKFKTIEDTEQIANAKLIAAAPDLLEALTHLVHNGGLMKYVSELEENSLLTEWYNKSINVINKATK
jgi:hypothetical protein